MGCDHYHQTLQSFLTAVCCTIRDLCAVRCFYTPSFQELIQFLFQRLTFSQIFQGVDKIISGENTVSVPKTTFQSDLLGC